MRNPFKGLRYTYPELLRVVVIIAIMAGVAYVFLGNGTTSLPQPLHVVTHAIP